MPQPASLLRHLIKNSKKILASSLAVLFSLSSITLPPSLAAETVSPVPVFNSQLLQQDFSGIHLPKEIGRIQETYHGGGNEVVILIQDAHSIPDAQKNIRSMIDFFQKTYGVSLVALEGASSQYDAQVFKSFPDQEAMNETFRQYLEAGELTGGTAAALFNKTPAHYYGIENWDLYEKGNLYFLKALEVESEIETGLEKIRQSLQREKQRIYSEDLLRVDAALQEFKHNRSNLMDVLGLLSQYRMPPADSELNLLLKESESAGSDASVEIEVKNLAESVRAYLKQQPLSSEITASLKRLNEKMQDFQTSRMPARDFALFLRELIVEHRIRVRVSKHLDALVRDQKRLRDIKGTEFFRNFERYAGQVTDSLFRNAEQKALDRESRLVDLIEGLMKLELTYEDWDRLRRFRQASEGKNIPVDGVILQSDVQRLFEKMQPHFAFYEIAGERDVQFYRRTFALMRKHQTAASIVVAGGFHTEGLTQQLKKQGMSYLLLMPHIDRLPEDHHYRDHMKGDVSWSSYFEIENGRVSLYKAFVRGARERLLKASKEEKGRLLKYWRDEIIRDLAKQNRLSEAKQYTQFIDEVTESTTSAQIENLRELWLANIDRFGAGLEKLQTEGRLSQNTVFELMQQIVRSQSAPTVLGAQLANGDAVSPAGLPVLSGRIEADQVTAAVSEAQSILDQAQTAEEPEEDVLPAARSESRSVQLERLSPEEAREALAQNRVPNGSNFPTGTAVYRYRDLSGNETYLTITGIGDGESGTPEQRNAILKAKTMLIESLLRARNFYPWKLSLTGIEITGLGGSSMAAPAGYGIRVNTEEFHLMTESILKNDRRAADQRKVRWAGAMIHEMIHEERDDGMVSSAPQTELISQMAEFLYAPARNAMFNGLVTESLDVVERTERRFEKARPGYYYDDAVKMMMILMADFLVEQNWPETSRIRESLAGDWGNVSIETLRRTVETIQRYEGSTTYAGYLQQLRTAMFDRYLRHSSRELLADVKQASERLEARTQQGLWSREKVTEELTRISENVDPSKFIVTAVRDHLAKIETDASVENLRQGQLIYEAFGVMDDLHGISQSRSADSTEAMNHISFIRESLGETSPENRAEYEAELESRLQDAQQFLTNRSESREDIDQEWIETLKAAGVQTEDLAAFLSPYFFNLAMNYSRFQSEDMSGFPTAYPDIIPGISVLGNGKPAAIAITSAQDWQVMQQHKEAFEKLGFEFVEYPSKTSATVTFASGATENIEFVHVLVYSREKVRQIFETQANMIREVLAEYAPNIPEYAAALVNPQLTKPERDSAIYDFFINREVSPLNDLLVGLALGYPAASVREFYEVDPFLLRGEIPGDFDFHFGAFNFAVSETDLQNGAVQETLDLWKRGLETVKAFHPSLQDALEEMVERHQAKVNRSESRTDTDASVLQERFGTGGFESRQVTQTPALSETRAISAAPVGPVSDRSGPDARDQDTPLGLDGRRSESRETQESDAPVTPLTQAPLFQALLHSSGQLYDNLPLTAVVLAPLGSKNNDPLVSYSPKNQVIMINSDKVDPQRKDFYDDGGKSHLDQLRRQLLKAAVRRDIDKGIHFYTTSFHPGSKSIERFHMMPAWLYDRAAKPGSSTVTKRFVENYFVVQQTQSGIFKFLHYFMAFVRALFGWGSPPNFTAYEIKEPAIPPSLIASEIYYDAGAGYLGSYHSTADRTFILNFQNEIKASLEQAMKELGFQYEGDIWELFLRMPPGDAGSSFSTALIWREAKIWGERLMSVIAEQRSAFRREDNGTFYSRLSAFLKNEIPQKMTAYESSGKTQSLRVAVFGAGMNEEPLTVSIEMERAIRDYADSAQISVEEVKRRISFRVHVFNRPHGTFQRLVDSQGQVHPFAYLERNVPGAYKPYFEAREGLLIPNADISGRLRYHPLNFFEVPANALMKTRSGEPVTFDLMAVHNVLTYLVLSNFQELRPGLDETTAQREHQFALLNLLNFIGSSSSGEISMINSGVASLLIDMKARLFDIDGAVARPKEGFAEIVQQIREEIARSESRETPDFDQAVEDLYRFVVSGDELAKGLEVLAEEIPMMISGSSEIEAHLNKALELARNALNEEQPLPAAEEESRIKNIRAFVQMARQDPNYPRSNKMDGASLVTMRKDFGKFIQRLGAIYERRVQDTLRSESRQVTQTLAVSETKVSDRSESRADVTQQKLEELKKAGYRVFISVYELGRDLENNLQPGGYSSASEAAHKAAVKSRIARDYRDSLTDEQMGEVFTFIDQATVYAGRSRVSGRRMVVVVPQADHLFANGARGYASFGAVLLNPSEMADYGDQAGAFQSIEQHELAHLDFNEDAFYASEQERKYVSELYAQLTHRLFDFMNGEDRDFEAFKQKLIEILDRQLTREAYTEKYGELNSEQRSQLTFAMAGVVIRILDRLQQGEVNPEEGLEEIRQLLLMATNLESLQQYVESRLEAESINEVQQAIEKLESSAHRQAYRERKRQKEEDEIVELFRRSPADIQRAIMRDLEEMFRGLQNPTPVQIAGLLQSGMNQVSLNEEAAGKIRYDEKTGEFEIQPGLDLAQLYKLTGEFTEIPQTDLQSVLANIQTLSPEEQLKEITGMMADVDHLFKSLQIPEGMAITQPWWVRLWQWIAGFFSFFKAKSTSPVTSELSETEVIETEDAKPVSAESPDSASRSESRTDPEFETFEAWRLISRDGLPSGWTVWFDVDNATALRDNQGEERLQTALKKVNEELFSIRETDPRSLFFGTPFVGHHAYKEEGVIYIPKEIPENQLRELLEGIRERIQAEAGVTLTMAAVHAQFKVGKGWFNAGRNRKGIEIEDRVRELVDEGKEAGRDRLLIESPVRSETRLPGGIDGYERIEIPLSSDSKKIDARNLLQGYTYDSEEILDIPVDTILPVAYRDVNSGQLFYVYHPDRRFSGIKQFDIYEKAKKIFPGLAEIRLTGARDDPQTFVLTEIVQTRSDEQLRNEPARLEDMFLAMVYLYSMDHHPGRNKNVHKRTLDGADYYVLFDYAHAFQLDGPQEAYSEANRQTAANKFEGLSLDLAYIDQRLQGFEDTGLISQETLTRFRKEVEEILKLHRSESRQVTQTPAVSETRTISAAPVGRVSDRSGPDTRDQDTSLGPDALRSESRTGADAPVQQDRFGTGRSESREDDQAALRVAQFLSAYISRVEQQGLLTDLSIYGIIEATPGNVLAQPREPVRFRPDQIERALEILGDGNNMNLATVKGTFGTGIEGPEGFYPFILADHMLDAVDEQFQEPSDEVLRAAVDQLLAQRKKTLEQPPQRQIAGQPVEMTETVERYLAAMAWIMRQLDEGTRVVGAAERFLIPETSGTITISKADLQLYLEKRRQYKTLGDTEQALNTIFSRAGRILQSQLYAALIQRTGAPQARAVMNRFFDSKDAGSAVNRLEQEDVLRWMNRFAAGADTGVSASQDPTESGRFGQQPDALRSESRTGADAPVQQGRFGTGRSESRDITPEEALAVAGNLVPANVRNDLPDTAQSQTLSPEEAAQRSADWAVSMESSEITTRLKEAVLTAFAETRTDEKKGNVNLDRAATEEAEKLLAFVGRANDSATARPGTITFGLRVSPNGNSAFLNQLFKTLQSGEQRAEILAEAEAMKALPEAGANVSKRTVRAADWKRGFRALLSDQEDVPVALDVEFMSQEMESMFSGILLNWGETQPQRMVEDFGELLLAVALVEMARIFADPSHRDALRRVQADPLKKAEYLRTQLSLRLADLGYPQEMFGFENGYLTVNGTIAQAFLEMKAQAMVAQSA